MGETPQMNKNAAVIVRKHRLLQVAFYVLVGIVLVLCVTLLPTSFTWIGAIIVILLYLLRAKIMRRLFDKSIAPILTQDRDPQLFKDILLGIKEKDENNALALIYEYYLGNYQFIVNTCKKHLEATPTSEEAYVYLYNLALVYFNLGDEEKLLAVCDAFNTRLKAETDEKIKETNYFVCMLSEFFTRYLENDFEHCEAFLEAHFPKGMRRDVPIIMLYLRAVLYYKAGRTAEARELFFEITQTAPKMYHAVHAKQHLDSIQAGKTYAPRSSDLLPQDETDPRKPTKKRSELFHILMIVVAVLILLIPISLLTDKNDKAIDKAAVEMLYEDVKILDSFFLERNGDTVESMCIASTSDAGLVVGCTYVYDDDEEDTVYFEPLAVRIEPGKAYTARGSVSGKFITFCFYENKRDIPDKTYYISSVRYDGKQLFFAVQYISTAW